MTLGDDFGMSCSDVGALRMSVSIVVYSPWVDFGISCNGVGPLRMRV